MNASGFTAAALAAAMSAVALSENVQGLEDPLFRLTFDGEMPPAKVAKGIQYVEGRSGRAAYFGKGSQLEFQSEGNLVQERGTVAMWVKRGWGYDDIEPDGVHPYRVLFGQHFEQGKRNGSGALQFWFIGPCLRGDPSDFGDSRVEQEEDCDNKWHQYVFTWDGADVRLGVDGELGGMRQIYSPGRKAMSSTATDGGPFAREGVEYFCVGGRDGGFPADSAIDDFRIYPRPLTADEVRSLFLETATQEEVSAAEARRHPDYANIFAGQKGNPYEGGKDLNLELVETIRLDKEGVESLVAEDRFNLAECSPQYGTLDGRPYFEAGTNMHSRFAVRFRLDPSIPLHVFDIDYPDNRKRTMDIIVQESQQVVWDGTPGADYTMQVGIMTGDQFPQSGHVQTHRCLYWTRPSGDVTLTAMTARPNDPAAISEIRVYKVADGRLPPLDVELPKPNEDGWRRSFALYFEDPAIGYDFAADSDGYTAGGLSEQIDRAAALMKYTGEDLLCYPGAWYYGLIGKDGYNPRRHAPDFLEAWYEKFDKEGLGIMPTLNFLEMPYPTPLKGAVSDGSLHDTPLSILDNGMIDTKGFHGRPPSFNIAHPDVQGYLLGVVGALLEQGLRHPSFKGICLHVSRHSFVTFGGVDSGYNDYCIERFSRECGIEIPIDRTAPLRGAEYAKWLREHPEAYEKWLEWRCSIVADFWGGVARGLRDARPDLKLMVNAFTSSSFVTKPGFLLPDALAEENRSFGLDTAMITARAPNIIVAQSTVPADCRWRFPAALGNDRQAERVAKVRDMFWQKETYSLLDGVDFPWAGQHDRYWESRIGKAAKGNSPQTLSCSWLKECPWRVTTINPGGRNALAHFALPMKFHDILGMSKGGFLIGTYGMESALREFMAEFRALPAVKFETLEAPYADVVFRHVRFDGHDWWYLLNTSDHAVSVRPELPADAVRVCGGADYGGGEIQLEAYQLMGFRKKSRVSFSVRSCYGDHMVLQRGKPVRIAGTATPGAAISGKFRGNQSSANADLAGNWVLEFPAGGVGGPFELTVSAESSVTFHDVMVGEVWFCSGQSNMEYPVWNPRNFWGLPDGESVAADGDDGIRLFLTPHGVAPDAPCEEPPGHPAWRLGTDPTAVKPFSAVAWFFAKELRRRLGLGVPIGLVESAWGGTTIQPWISESTLAVASETTELAFIKEAQAMRDGGEGTEHAEVHPKVSNDDVRTSPRTPSTLFNAMVSPYVCYPMRGAIWYQGCANAGVPEKYRDFQREIVEDWRKSWNDPSFVFIGTQLAAFRAHHPAEPFPADFWKNDAPGSNVGYAPIRDSQTVLFDIPGCGLACTIDVGDPSNIHPSSKREVGERLANEAMRLAYGDASALPGPRGVAAKAEGPGTVRVMLDNLGEGIEMRGAAAVGDMPGRHLFALFDVNGKGEWADARIDADGTIIVSAPGVGEPVRVEYAWCDFPYEPSLYRKGDGIPVFPFRIEVEK